MTVRKYWDSAHMLIIYYDSLYEDGFSYSSVGRARQAFGPGGVVGSNPTTENIFMYI